MVWSPGDVEIDDAPDAPQDDELALAERWWLFDLLLSTTYNAYHAVDAPNPEEWARLHPRWPAHTPGGLGGKFMKVGQHFVKDGVTYRVTAVGKGFVHVSETIGAMHGQTTPIGQQLSLKSIPDANGEHFLPGIEPSPLGVSQPVGTEAINPTVAASGPHDPSLKNPFPTDKVTDEQWLRFGKLDQENAIRVQELFGKWTATKAKTLANKTFNDADAYTRERVHSGFGSQYGSSSGKSLSLEKFMGGGAGEETLRKAFELQRAYEDVGQWDLYNRIGTPDVLLFHAGGKPGTSTAAKAKAAYSPGGQFGHVKSGQSYAWTPFGWGEPILHCVPFSIRHILMHHKLASPTTQGGSASSYKSENEFAIRPKHAYYEADQLIIAKADLSPSQKKYLQAITDDGKVANGAEWLEFLSNLKHGTPLPVPPSNPQIQYDHVAGKATPQFKVPPPDALAHGLTLPKGGSDPEKVTDMSLKPGDYLEGMKGTRYIVVKDPSTWNGLRYVKLTDPKKNYPFDPPASGQPFYKLAGSYTLPAEPRPAGKPDVFDPETVQPVGGEPMWVHQMSQGSVVEVQGDWFQLQSDGSVGGYVPVKNLTTDQTGKLNTDAKLPLFSIGPPPPPPAPTLQQGMIFGFAGDKHVVTKVLKSGEVWAKGPSGKVVFAPGSFEHDGTLGGVDLYDPAAHDMADAKTKLGQMQPGDYFHAGAGTGTHKPFKVLSQDGKTVWALNIATGETQPFTKNQSAKRLVPKAAATDVDEQAASTAQMAAAMQPDPNIGQPVTDINSLVEGQFIQQVGFTEGGFKVVKGPAFPGDSATVEMKDGTQFPMTQGSLTTPYEYAAPPAWVSGAKAAPLVHVSQLSKGQKIQAYETGEIFTVVDDPTEHDGDWSVLVEAPGGGYQSALTNIQPGDWEIVGAKPTKTPGSAAAFDALEIGDYLKSDYGADYKVLHASSTTAMLVKVHGPGVAEKMLYPSEDTGFTWSEEPPDTSAGIETDATNLMKIWPPPVGTEFTYAHKNGGPITTWKVTGYDGEDFEAEVTQANHLATLEGVHVGQVQGFSPDMVHAAAEDGLWTVGPQPAEAIPPPAPAKQVLGTGTLKDFDWQVGDQFEYTNKNGYNGTWEVTEVTAKGIVPKKVKNHYGSPTTDPFPGKQWSFTSKSQINKTYSVEVATAVSPGHAPWAENDPILSQTDVETLPVGTVITSHSAYGDFDWKVVPAGFVGGKGLVNVALVEQDPNQEPSPFGSFNYGAASSSDWTVKTMPQASVAEPTVAQIADQPDLYPWPVGHIVLKNSDFHKIPDGTTVKSVTSGKVYVKQGPDLTIDGGAIKIESFANAVVIVSYPEVPAAPAAPEPPAPPVGEVGHVFSNPADMHVLPVGTTIQRITNQGPSSPHTIVEQNGEKGIEMEGPQGTLHFIPFEGLAPHGWTVLATAPEPAAPPPEAPPLAPGAISPLEAGTQFHKFHHSGKGPTLKKFAKLKNTEPGQIVADKQGTAYQVVSHGPDFTMLAHQETGANMVVPHKWEDSKGVKGFVNVAPVASAAEAPPPPAAPAPTPGTVKTTDIPNLPEGSVVKVVGGSGEPHYVKHTASGTVLTAYGGDTPISEYPNGSWTVESGPVPPPPPVSAPDPLEPKVGEKFNKLQVAFLPVGTKVDITSANGKTVTFTTGVVNEQAVLTRDSDGMVFYPDTILMSTDTVTVRGLAGAAPPTPEPTPGPTGNLVVFATTVGDLVDGQEFTTKHPSGGTNLWKVMANHPDALPGKVVAENIGRVSPNGTYLASTSGIVHQFPKDFEFAQAAVPGESLMQDLKPEPPNPLAPAPYVMTPTETGDTFHKFHKTGSGEGVKANTKLKNAPINGVVTDKLGQTWIVISHHAGHTVLKKQDAVAQYQVPHQWAAVKKKDGSIVVGDTHVRIEPF
jgi:hypothetical protein